MDDGEQAIYVRYGEGRGRISMCVLVGDMCMSPMDECMMDNIYTLRGGKGGEGRVALVQCLTLHRSPGHVGTGGARCGQACV